MKYVKSVRLIFRELCMNLGISAIIISVLFVLFKMALNYKDSPKPDLKDGLVVFISSIAGLYALENYSLVKSKGVEVFTAPPEF